MKIIMIIIIITTKKTLNVKIIQRKIFQAEEE